MLQNLEDQLRECLQRAADCAMRAKEATDLRERENWLLLHARYLELSRGITQGNRTNRPAKAARSEVTEQVPAVSAPALCRDQGAG